MNFRIRGWTFTHWWVRPVVKVWFDIYHKSVTYSGTKHIDWQRPIIFAASHQNAFTDALCLILPTKYTNDRFIYPLTRADAFGNSKAVDWILTAFHMLPVYRPKDKVDIKRQNDTVFGHCYDILSKNRNLLIHPEGNCFAIKEVRRFKKGLARIALRAEDNHEFNLGATIVPVGINYRDITGARKGIHIRFGKPIEVADYKYPYSKHANSAATTLTRHVEKAVKQITVDIHCDQDYEFTEQFVELAKKCEPDFAGTASYTSEEIDFEKKQIEKLEKARDENPELYRDLQELMAELFELMSEHKLNLNYPLIQSYSLQDLILRSVLFILLLPVFVYGLIGNIIPWLLTHKLADRIKDAQFKSSARMVLGLLLFPLCYLFQGTIVWWGAGGWWAVAYLLTGPFAGVLSLNVWEKWKAWKQQIRLRYLPLKAKNKLSGLIDNMFSKLKAGIPQEPLSDTAQS